MSLQALVDLCRQSKDVDQLRQALQGKSQQGHLITGLSGGQRSLFLSTIYDPQRVMLIVTVSLMQAERLAADLTGLLPEARILIWEGNELMPQEEALTALDLRASRLEVLQEGDRPGTIILAPVGSLLEGLLAPECLRKSELSINIDSRLDLEQLALDLVALGYERVPLVESWGQFSIRGGILDVAPFHLEHPVRIEFFGDEVDSMRLFDFSTQKSLENVQEVTLKAARETIYDPGDLGSIKEAIWQAVLKQGERLHKLDLAQEADDLLAQGARHLEAFDQQGYFPGMNQYKMFFGEIVTLLEYLPGDTMLVLDEPVRLKEAVTNTSMEIGEHFAQLLKGGRILSSLSELFWDWNALWAKFQSYSPIYLSVLGKRVTGMEGPRSMSLGLRMPEHFGGSIERMLRRVKQLRKEHYRILILVSSKERGRRILELLQDDDLPAVYVDQLQRELQIGNSVITTGNLETGFEFPAFKLAVLTELELYGRQRSKPRPAKVEEGLRILPQELKTGDYVVHINHGIGQYLGIEVLQVDNRSKDYLHIRYAGQDRLYVPQIRFICCSVILGWKKGHPAFPSWAETNGPGSKSGPKNRYRKWPRVSSNSMPSGKPSRVLPSPRILPGKGTWRTPFPIRRLRIKPGLLPQLSRIWKNPAPWIACSAAMWAMVRRKWPFVPPLRLWPAVNRWLSWFPPPSWPSSINARLKNVSKVFPSRLPQ